MSNPFLIVSTASDDPFAIDVAYGFGLQSDISDQISLKLFANREFCPRFIAVGAESDYSRIGHGLNGKTIVIVSTCCGNETRNDLAMRNFLVARAAKDNGAEKVLLVEPDLFYSAQDRGPRAEQGDTAFPRDIKDLKKFDGQPFSSLLYAQLLAASGVDMVVTVHNHSVSVDRLFSKQFEHQFFNLSPAELYADYLAHHEIGRPIGSAEGFLVCAPDGGAAPFAREVFGRLGSELGRLLFRPEVGLLLMDKARTGERQVDIRPSEESPVNAAGIEGRDVIVLDDMVRTGYTIMECCKILKQNGARRVIFVVTHFHSSEEVKENLSHPAIDEIVTTNTIPSVLNRDMQGRLRRKMLVLKIEKWIANFLRRHFLGSELPLGMPPYAVDISSKNPRWLPHEHLRE